MGQPHKHAELIKAWAEGAEIQDYDEELGKWCNSGTHPMWVINKLYRIKPKTIRYRNFLWGSAAADKPVISVTTYEENQREPRCNWPGFTEWLGDWVEVEV